MKNNTISFTYKELTNDKEMDASDIELVLSARKSAMNAYAPYSGFRVGAAAILQSGTIVCGTNVENAAFPSGICAERNVISNVVSNHPGDNIISLAIAAFSGDVLTGEPVPPCGNCRQVIAEEEARNGRQIRIILSGSDRTYIIDSIGNLLPLQFNKENLGISLP
jgi:cytidine deaminase